MAETAIVTGANSGIGQATAIALAQAGYDVGFTHFDDEVGVGETASQIEAHGRRCVHAPLDLTEPAAGPPVIEGLIEALGGLDVYVNNAGMSEAAPYLEIDLDSWRRVTDVNLTGAFLCGQAAARRMVAQGRGGRIVNVTSVHERAPLENAGSYCAAKAGLGMLTQTMALELARHGIRVNAIAPGEIATRTEEDPSRLERPMIPAGRPGVTGEIAGVIVFLVSPAASYATGQTFAVDGGMLLMAGVANQRTAWWGRAPTSPPSTLRGRVAARLRPGSSR